MCTKPLIAQRKNSIFNDNRLRILGSIDKFPYIHQLSDLITDPKTGTVIPHVNNIDFITGEVLYPFYVGCGQCAECRLEYSRGWANRCVMEALTCQREDVRNCWFVTLTYNDDSISKYGLNDTASGLMTLNYDHLQLFMKSLRRHYEYHAQDKQWNYNNIRFYACGEYGEQTHRPHFHVLLFDCPILDKDLKLLGKTKLGYPLYNVDYITKLWNKGHVVIADLTWETCAYTARYVMKKLKGKDACFYELNDVEKEDVRMSRKPGIGLEYFNNHWHEMYYFNDPNDISKGASSKVILPALSKDRPNTGKPPRYFDEKMKDIDLSLIERVKASRLQKAMIMDDNLHRASNLTDKQRFEINENTVTRKSKMLLREFTNFIS